MRLIEGSVAELEATLLKLLAGMKERDNINKDGEFTCEYLNRTLSRCK